MGVGSLLLPWDPGHQTPVIRCLYPLSISLVVFLICMCTPVCTHGHIYVHGCVHTGVHTLMKALSGIKPRQMASLQSPLPRLECRQATSLTCHCSNSAPVSVATVHFRAAINLLLERCHNLVTEVIFYSQPFSLN